MSTKVASSKSSSAPRVKKTVQLATETTTTVQPPVSTEHKKSAIKKDKEPVSTVTPVTVVEVEHQEDVTKSDKKFVTSEDVITVVNNTISKLKEESAHAKARKDKATTSTLNELVKNLNSIKKPIDKLARSKPPRKQINIDGNRNGFLKPVLISDDLASFLKCESGSLKSRVEVTRAICEYIEVNKLQNPKNRREINVDQTLQKLLNYNPDTESTPLTYYMIQSRIQRHFLKPTAQSA
jgi:chromatin remodeling complex protein RSC6